MSEPSVAARNVARARGPKVTKNRSRAGLALIVLAMVLAVLLALGLPTSAVIIGYKWHQQKEIDAAADPATSAAVKAAEQLLSYDYRTLDKEEADDNPLLSSGYADDFSQTFESIVGGLSPKNKPEVVASVVSSAVLECSAECSPDRVAVLMFVDQVNNSQLAASSAPAQNRVVFTMVKEGDTWLVDEITAM